jgi:hypothetical protein
MRLRRDGGSVLAAELRRYADHTGSHETITAMRCDELQLSTL